MSFSSGRRRIWVGAAVLSLVITLVPATPADAATCTPAQVLPRVADASVIQGIGSNTTVSAGYAPLARGKETLVRVYLTQPLSTVCTLGSTQSIKVTGASLSVNNGMATFGGITAYNAFGTGQLVAATMQANSLADPLFVVPGSNLAPGTGPEPPRFDATFTATISFAAKSGTAITNGTLTVVVGPRTFEKRTDALRILVVPMGDAAQTYSSQFTAAGQVAVQNAMTTLARLYPVEPRTGELNTATGGIRYTIVTPAMLNLKAVPGAYDANGKFCGAQSNFDAIKGQLAQFLLSWNTGNTLSPADRVLGVVDSNISDGSAFGCAEGFSAINGVEAWIRAIPDKPAAGKTPAQPSMSGALAGMEISHTFGLQPLSRPTTEVIGYHATSAFAVADPNSRGYDVTRRSLIVDNRNVMRLDTAKPWNNTTVLMAVKDYADLVCFLGGAPNTECTANTVTGTSTGVLAGVQTFVLSGTTDGTEPGTSVVESYVASGVAQTRAPADSEYFLDQYVGVSPTPDSQKVNVSFGGSHHDGAGPHGADVEIGVFALAYPSNVDTSRIVFRKGTTVLYERIAQTNPPLLGTVTTTNAGAPFNFTNTRGENEGFPAISPDRNWIAYTTSAGSDSGSQILVAPVDGHRAPVAVPADISTSPGSRIAFASDRDGNWEIYTSNLDGTNLLRLTEDGSLDFLPRFSPDGTKIVFVSDRTETPEIYVMNSDGSSPTALTVGLGAKNGPTWSPDGLKIAYAKETSNQNYDIWTMNADGTNQVQITTNTANDHSPAWSPLGSKIAFVSTRSGTSQIWSMNVDGTSPLNVTNTLTTELDPAWSPNGTKIAFRSDRDTSPICLAFPCLNEIYVMNADGTGQTRLTDINDGYFDALPAWSPDGTKIGFQGRLAGGNEDLFVMNADGTDRTNLTDSCCEGSPRSFNFDWDPSGGLRYDALPAWRGDGAELAFTSGSELVRVAVDTSSGTPSFGPRQVVFDATSVDEEFPGRPTYSPDGADIAFALDDHIWRVPATGGSATQITTGTDLDNWPSWSRTTGDGRIVFTRQVGCEVECFYSPALYTVDPASPATTQEPIPGGEGAQDGEMPSWGTAGRIAFVRGSVFDAARAIWSIGSNGEGLEQLTSGTDDIAPSLAEPLLAFSRTFSESESSQTDIMLANLTKQGVVAEATGDHPELFKADLFLDCAQQHFPADVGVPTSEIVGAVARFTFNFDQSLACGEGTPTLSVYVNNGVQRSGPTTSSPPLAVTTTPKGPRAAIYSPIDGTEFCLACRLPFAGSGKDAENGELTGTSVRWFITPPGGAKTPLGTGANHDAIAPPAGWTAGINTITIEATDSNGNVASATTTIVIGFDFTSGFLAPVNNLPTVNTGNGGRTYPVKFQLPKPDGTFYSELSAVASITYQQVSCGDFGNAIADPLETTASGGSVLRYEPGANQYIYNWKTPGPGCFALIVTLADGSEHRAEFNLK